MIQAVGEESVVNARKKTVNKSSYWSLDGDYTYTGSAIIPGEWVLGIKDNKLVDELSNDLFTIKYSKNVNASKTNTTNDMAYVTLSAASNQTYLFGSRKIYFMINQADITGDLFSIASQTYTGEKIVPSISAKYRNISMVKGTDYKVTFTNNIKPGTANAEITGQGNFKGTVTKTFTINKVSLSACEVKWVNDTIIPIMTADFLEDQIVHNEAVGEIGYNWYDTAEVPNGASLEDIENAIASLEDKCSTQQ